MGNPDTFEASAAFARLQLMYSGHSASLGFTCKGVGPRDGHIECVRAKPYFSTRYLGMAQDSVILTDGFLCFL